MGCRPAASQKMQRHNVVIGIQVGAAIEKLWIRNQVAKPHILIPEIKDAMRSKAWKKKTYVDHIAIYLILPETKSQIPKYLIAVTVFKMKILKI